MSIIVAIMAAVVVGLLIAVGIAREFGIELNNLNRLAVIGLIMIVLGVLFGAFLVFAVVGSGSG